MCGRLGSMFTVCDSPTWLVRPIVTGLRGSVTSMISRPPGGACDRPPVPWSWQRPRWSVASSRSCVSRAIGGEHVGVEDRARPSGSPRRRAGGPSAASGWLRQEAVGSRRDELAARRVSPSVSWKIVCPPPLAPIASVPTEANVLPPCSKKSRSVCGLPVGSVVTSSHLAPLPPDWKAGGRRRGRAERRGRMVHQLEPWPACADAGSASGARSASKTSHPAGPHHLARLPGPANGQTLDRAGRLVPAPGRRRPGHGRRRPTSRPRTGWRRPPRRARPCPRRCRRRPRSACRRAAARAGGAPCRWSSRCRPGRPSPG